MSYSTERYKQVARACKVLELLQNSRYGKTAKELRDEAVQYMGLASVSLKSIERDIKFWQGYGFPIEAKKTADPDRRTVWKLDKSCVKLPALEISVMELLAFAAGRELLLPLAGTPYWEGIQMLWNRMRQSLPESLWEHFEKLRPSLIVRGVVSKSYADKEGMLSALNRALYQHRVTTICYQSLDGGSARERRIEPHAIVLFQGNIYTVATDAGVEHGEFKLFKLDRLTRVEPGDDRFTPRPDFDPETLFAASMGVFRSGEPTRFLIRLDSLAARWAAETPLHPTQILHPDQTGIATLEIPSAYEEEVISRVLGFGEHAEVLEPAGCREHLREILRKLAKTYNLTQDR